MSTITGTDQNFNSEVKEFQGKVLVDFWAPWCGPCQILGPIIEDIGKELGDKVKVVKVNVDEQNELAAEFDITAIPTSFFLKTAKPSKLSPAFVKNRTISTLLTPKGIIILSEFIQTRLSSVFLGLSKISG